MQQSFARSWSALALIALLNGSAAAPVNATAATRSANSEPDAAEAAGLSYMREEEKLARDVYTYLYPLWNTTVFANIGSSEQEHFEAIGGLLDRYRLDDPARRELPGVFQNLELQALYDQLIARAAASELAALQVGALIEETDMVDIAKALAETDQADIIQVYENLLRGSRNHLRAFVDAIEAQGVPYTAQVLSQERVDAIVDAPVERGRQ